MEFLNGYKTIIGASFGALTFFCTGVESLFSPEAVILVKATLGSLAIFFAGVGIAGKCDKMAK